MSFQIKKIKRNALSLGVMTAIASLSPNLIAQDREFVEEEVIVTGIRSSLMQSQDIKRNAGSVVDAITAVDIGKLPDATIADSLQRITGIQITRTGGEGSIVNIRGNENVTTTLNGEQMLAAGSITTVAPDFSDIPSTMVSGLEVFKSAEARNVVAGLSGTINLKTNRPFMLDDGLTALAKVEATHGSLGGETDPGVSAFLGYNKDDKIGATLNVSYTQSYLADYNNGSQGAERNSYGGWSFNATEASTFVIDDVDANGDGDSNDVFFTFQGHQAGNRFIDRDRTGINGAFQVQVTDSVSLTSEVFYTLLDEHQYFAGFVASQGWSGGVGWFSPENITEHANIVRDEDGNPVEIEGSYYTYESALLQARTVKVHNQTWKVNREALNTNIELEFDNGGPLTGTVRWVHGEATNEDSRSIIDGTITSDIQSGSYYHGYNGIDLSPANPWGYNGLPRTLPNGQRPTQLNDDGSTVLDDDGNPVYLDTGTQIPIHISYDNGNQNWILPTLEEPLYDANGNPLLDGNSNPVMTTEKFGSNLDRYSLRSTNLYGTYQNAELDILRIDGSFDFSSDHLQSVDVGLRYGQRDVKKSGWYGGVARTNEYGDAFLSRWKDTASQAPDTLESFITPISYQELADQGMITSVSDFHGTTGLESLYFVDPKAMDDPVAWHTDIYGPHVLVPDAANIYQVQEETQSAYIQANFEGDTQGFPYRLNIGFRYIETEFDIDQSIALNGSVANFNGQDYLIGSTLGIAQPVGEKFNTNTGYSDFLPSVNYAIDFTDNQVFRFSFTKTIATHDTDMLGGGLTVNRIRACTELIDSSVDIFCATGGGQEGNPNLEPNRNNNVEASYEWYFNDVSMVSLGLFQVTSNTGFQTILEQRTDDAVADSDGVVRGYDLTTHTFTGSVPIQTTITTETSSHTRGVEFSYQQGFDFLPGFWSGLGVSANYTFSPGTSNDTDYYGKTLPGIGNSKKQSNFSLWYEKDGLQMRIAHNYRSEMYGGLKNEAPYRFAWFTAPTNYVDASISYDINDNIVVSLQGTNLTEEYQETYHQWKSNTDQRFYNERRLTLGLQAKF